MMKANEEIEVFGVGVGGTAIANLVAKLANNGYVVRLWAREFHVMEKIATMHFTT